MILAAISKLPHDLFPVMPILPFWMTILYYSAWVIGSALVLSLILLALKKLFEFLRKTPEVKPVTHQPQKRRYSKEEVLNDIRLIFDNSLKKGEHREALHRMSACLKSYFEILIKKDIEEMTASEIRDQIKENQKLGRFFTELSVAQYSQTDPSAETLTQSYNQAITLVKEGQQ